jgi:hypothetical protein
MAAGLDSLMGLQQDSREVLQHLSKTYRSVNLHLQQNEVPSEATVAAVMSLAIHEDLIGQLRRKKMHMDALCTMVNMRGGLSAFECNTVLLQKICRYV